MALERFSFFFFFPFGFIFGLHLLLADISYDPLFFLPFRIAPSEASPITSPCVFHFIRLIDSGHDIRGEYWNRTAVYAYSLV